MHRRGLLSFRKGSVEISQDQPNFLQSFSYLNPQYCFRSHFSSHLPLSHRPYIFSAMSNSGAISFTNLLSPEPSTSNLLLVFLLLSIALPFQSLIISFFKSQIWPSLGFKRSRQCYSKWFYLPDTQPWPLPEPVSDDFQLSKSIEPKFRPFKWGPTYTINSE